MSVTTGPNNTPSGIPDAPLASDALTEIVNRGTSGIGRKDLAAALEADETEGHLRKALGDLLIGRFVEMKRVGNKTAYVATHRGRKALE